MKNRIILWSISLSVIISGCSQRYLSNKNPVNLGPNVNSSFDDGSPCISADGRSLYFDSLRPGGLGFWDIWVTQTATPYKAWKKAVCLPEPVNSIYSDTGPCITDDGLKLYFASDRPGGYGDFDIWVTTRKTTGDPWEEPVNLGPIVNSWAYDNHPSISADSLSLYFDSRRPNVSGPMPNNDIYVTRRATTNDPWSIPENFGPSINTINIEYSPDISKNDLVLYFDSRITDRDLWMAQRETSVNDWGKGINLGPPFNTAYIDTDPSICSNGSILYFVSNRPEGSGRFDIWQIRIMKKSR